jgi:hypothetical protein
MEKKNTFSNQILVDFLEFLAKEIITSAKSRENLKEIFLNEYQVREKEIWDANDSAGYIEKIIEDLKITIANENLDYDFRKITDITKIILNRLKYTQEIAPYTKYLLNVIIELFTTRKGHFPVFDECNYAISINTNTIDFLYMLVLFLFNFSKY